MAAPPTFLFVIPLALIPWVISMLFAFYGGRSLSITSEGKVAAAHWLGVREFLVEHGMMADVPAGGVAVWDRYVAVAATFGLAPEAIDDLVLRLRTRPSGSDLALTWRLMRDKDAMAAHVASAQADQRAALRDGFSADAPFGPGDGGFCDLVRRFGEGVRIGAPLDGAGREQWLLAARARLGQIEAAAPAELRSDVATLRHAWEAMPTQPPPAGSSADRPADPALVAAADRVRATIKETCRIDVDWLGN